MKLHETLFARQFVAVVVGVVLSVASVAFVSIPYNLAASDTMTHLS